MRTPTSSPNIDRLPRASRMEKDVAFPAPPAATPKSRSPDRASDKGPVNSEVPALRLTRNSPTTDMTYSYSLNRLTNSSAASVNLSTAAPTEAVNARSRSEEHTSELQSLRHL